MKPDPIFVTGSGRSGTWVLYNSLACHRDVHTFPREIRLIIDPDGLRDLVFALTDGYHPVNSSEAIFRFEQLMLLYLAQPNRRPYRGFDMPTWVGPDYYAKRVRAFIEQLYDHAFTGQAWHIESQREGRLVELAREVQALRYARQRDRFRSSRVSLLREDLKVARYFSQRQELTTLCAGLINDLFCHAAHLNGKQTWAEKTPQHLLSLDFLWELFPDCAVIHMKRDPRGVVHSLTRQPWAPSDVRGAALWLRNVYQRWLDLRAGLDLEKRRFIEIKLEEFALDPRAYLTQVAGLAGLDDQFDNLPEISLERVDYWRKSMPAADQQIVLDTLGPCFEEMGYIP